MGHKGTLDLAVAVHCSTKGCNAKMSEESRIEEKKVTIRAHDKTLLLVDCLFFATMCESNRSQVDNILECRYNILLRTKGINTIV
jgi:hypothetical protein